jgi:nucleotide-binding universal stress UspA family protein
MVEGRGFDTPFQPEVSAAADSTRLDPVGDPVVSITKSARGWQADLVVIGSHDRDGLGRVLSAT